MCHDWVVTGNRCLLWKFTWGLQGEERSTNATPIEEAQEVSLEENATIFSSRNATRMEEV